MEGPTFYEIVGEANLKKLVQIFYAKVYTHPILKEIFKADIEEVRKKQYMFLTQFLGGPTLYSNEYGHPRMRMRHLPHRITNEAKDAWLACMMDSIEELDLEDNVKMRLFSLFPKIAQHMVNTFE